MRVVLSLSLREAKILPVNIDEHHNHAEVIETAIESIPKSGAKFWLLYANFRFQVAEWERIARLVQKIDPSMSRVLRVSAALAAFAPKQRH
jgi:hypothetical protein